MGKKRIRASRIVLQIVSVSFSILLLLLATAGLYQAGKKAYRFGYRIFTEQAVEEAPGTDVSLQVKEGMSGYELAELMERKGLVKSANLFFVQLKLSSEAKKIEPDTYTLNTSMDADELIAVLAKKDDEKQEKE